MDNVVIFPVRHHSPAASVALRDMIMNVKPSTILIEGPSDYNPFFRELFYPHQLPVAIYSYIRNKDGQKSGVYYPFCCNSPEWVAIQTGMSIGCKTQFIDLPWLSLEHLQTNADCIKDEKHEYSDMQLRRSSYVHKLCKSLGVDDFDALWDELFEIDDALTPNEYVKRCRIFCDNCRNLDHVDPVDDAREAFMAGQILQVIKSVKGPVFVVCGGYHASALERRIRDNDTASDLLSVIYANPPQVIEQGINLTPYSDYRLDNLKGYEAGMPGPGFYRKVWEKRSKGEIFDSIDLLKQIASVLRDKKVHFSSADFIAITTTSRALADIRGHKDIWRRDLTDGIRGALIKDELDNGFSHPVLQIINQVYRGDVIGKLAEGTTVPPLTKDIEIILKEMQLYPDYKKRSVELDLNSHDKRLKSNVLHQLVLLGIGGYHLHDGIDIVQHDNSREFLELWEIIWVPEFDSSIIEKARYGPTLADAARQALIEKIQTIGRNTVKAAQLLIEAALAGLDSHLLQITDQLLDLIRNSTDFIEITKALDYLLYLFNYDTVLHFTDTKSLSTIIAETWRVSLYQLENLGNLQNKDKELLSSIRTVVHCYERNSEKINLRVDEIIPVLCRVHEDSSQCALVRGACLGGLWMFNASSTDDVLKSLRLFCDPSILGDFLSGLFSIAREIIQRDKRLLNAIDERISEFSSQEYLEALPALRLAFTFFTPREKSHLAIQLVGENSDVANVTFLSSSIRTEEIKDNIAFESNLVALALKYGIGVNSYE